MLRYIKLSHFSGNAYICQSQNRYQFKFINNNLQKYKNYEDDRKNFNNLFTFDFFLNDL